MEEEDHKVERLHGAEPPQGGDVERGREANPKDGHVKDGVEGCDCVVKRRQGSKVELLLIVSVGAAIAIAAAATRTRLVVDREGDEHGSEIVEHVEDEEDEEGGHIVGKHLFDGD